MGESVKVSTIIEIISYAVIFLVGLVGNIIVSIVTISGGLRRRTASHLYILNLAIADLLVIIIYIPFYIAYYLKQWRWTFGLFLCKTVFTLAHLCLYVSLGTLVAISIERYRLLFLTHLKKPRIKVALFLIWSASLAMSLPLIMYLKVEQVDEDVQVCQLHWPTENYEKISQPTDFFLFYLTPLVIMLVIYIRIMRKLNQVGAENAGKKFSFSISHHQEAMFTMIAVVTAFALLVLPVHIYQGLKIYNPEALDAILKKCPWFFTLCVGLSLSTHAVNPIIYSFLSRNFRNRVWTMIKQKLAGYF